MPNWIESESLVNLRDTGGIPLTDGGEIRPGRLLRSDNLQDLTAADIADLRQRGLTDVVDLRSVVEVKGEGPGPLTAEPWVTIHHYSLFQEVVEPDGEVELESSATGENPEPIDVIDADDPEATPHDGPVTAPATAPAEALPWVGRASTVSDDDANTGHYLSYLIDRPDSVLASLRVIADADGATLVHCAAGKDRTGTIVALALLLVGADPGAVIDDYAASSERIEQIVARLIASPTYFENLSGRPMSSHLTRPETMRRLISRFDAEGGVAAVLARYGWTDADTDRLRAKLLDA